MQLNTVREQDAYDKGWADAADWWGPLERDRILQAIQPWFAKQLEEDRLSRNDILEFIELINGEEK